MMMRAYHRWVGLVGAVVMIFVSITGMALQIDLWLTNTAPPGTEPPPPEIERKIPANDALTGMVAAAMTKAVAVAPDMDMKQVQVIFTEDAPQIVIGGSHFLEKRVSIDMGNGRVVVKEAEEPGWHFFLQNIHAGYSFGLIGRILSMVAGISLLVLGVTGLLIYSDLYSRRRKAGKKAMFWKK